MKLTTTTNLALAGLVVAAMATGAAAALAPAGFLLAADGGEKGKSEKKVEKKVEEKVEVKTRETVEIVVKGGSGKAETIRFEGLAPGQTKEVKTSSGKTATVKRTADGYSVKLDGKEIAVDLPGDDVMGTPMPGKSCLPGMAGMHRMEKHGMGGGCCCCGGGMAHGGMSCASGHGHGHGRERVVVLDTDDDDGPMWMSDLDGDDEDVVMEFRGAGHPARAGTMGTAGPACGRMDDAELDKLESMKGVDAKTRDKIREVLREVAKKHEAAGPKVIRKKVVVSGDDGPGEVEKRVKVIVVRDDDEKLPEEKPEKK